MKYVILFGVIFWAAMIYFVVEMNTPSAEELAFIEIHGTETNDCWCPDDCKE